MTTVKQILDLVANDPSKNAKIAILTANKDNKDLQEVCRLAYDPTVNFYLKKIPAYNATGSMSLDWAIDQLGELSSRRVTGGEGIAHLTLVLNSLTADDAEVLAKVISRDLRSGFSDSTTNKVWKNLIPEFPYMRCSLPKAVKLDQFSWTEGVYSQLKADGMYANVNHDADGNVTILSRSGTQFPLEQFADLVADVQTTFPLGTQSHGELLVEQNGTVLPRQIGNGMLNKVAQGGVFPAGCKAVYLVWDQIALSAVVAKGVYAVPYKTRFATLKSQITTSHFIKLIPTVIVHNMEEALVHYREMLAEGLEGTIIKHGEGEWKDGTSKHQVKMKLDIDVDLVIVGFNAGNGKNADTFGSIVCRSSDGLLEVSISGFTDEMRQEVHNTRDELMGTIVTVKGNSIMPPSGNNTKYSLFLPRFAEFRKDKTVADTMAKVQEQFDNAVK
jgi:DNA ligase-1